MFALGKVLADSGLVWCIIDGDNSQRFKYKVSRSFRFIPPPQKNTLAKASWFSILPGNFVDIYLEILCLKEIRFQCWKGLQLLKVFFHHQQDATQLAKNDYVRNRWAGLVNVTAFNVTNQSDYDAPTAFVLMEVTVPA